MTRFPALPLLSLTFTLFLAAYLPDSPSEWLETTWATIFCYVLSHLAGACNRSIVSLDPIIPGLGQAAMPNIV